MSAMSELDMDRQLLDAVSAAMEEPDVFHFTNAPEHKIAMALRSAFEGLDEIMVMAAHPDTSHLVDAERVAVGQLILRAQLIGSFLMSRKAHSRVVGRA